MTIIITITIIITGKFLIDKPFVSSCHMAVIESLRIIVTSINYFDFLQIDEIFQLYLYEEKMREGKVHYGNK